MSTSPTQQVEQLPDSPASRNELPEGWATTTFMDIFDIQGGTQPPKKHFIYEPRDSYIRLLQIRDFGEKPLPTYIPVTKALKTCGKEDILIGRYGASVGRICTGMEGAYNVALTRVTIPSNLDRRFVYYLLKSYWFQCPILGVERSAQDGFNKGNLARIHVPICPIPEQHRIVAKVEELLARVNAARDHLAKAPKILKAFRQSILAAACSGRLTEDWREQCPNVQAGSAVLEQVLKSRRALWEREQLEHFRKKGMQPSDQKWKVRYKQPQSANTEELPDLPSTWVWATVESLSTKVVDGVHKKPDYVDDGIPFVTVRNLTAGRGTSFENLNYVSEADHQKFIERANPERGDLLVTKDGTLGVVRQVRTNRPFSIFVSVALVKPVSKDMSDYLEIALSAPQVQDQMLGTGSGLQHIHLRDLRADCVPLPPLEEQHEIVRRVEALFKLADTIEERVETATKRADKLTQSILAKAFRGKLVPTEAELARREGRSYEPASVLLERIKTERATQAQHTKTTERGKRRGQRPRQLSLEAT